jgi:mono/diheme cytochrome c family protein
MKLVLFVSLTAVVAFADDATERLFVRRIQPLFAEKCLACHGQDESKLKGDFDMRSLESLQKGGESEKPGIALHQASQSPIYLAATREHADWEAMPPKEADKLTAEQLGWLKQWIDQGASWPSIEAQKKIAAANESAWSAEDGMMVKTSGGQSADWTNRKYKPEGLWGYQPVKKPFPRHPETHPVDEFLQVPATAAGPASAEVFIRRATFDLTGLPPDPQAVVAFSASYASEPEAAIGQLIDDLLASPHYGERMAQHWLDVVRYADSSGFANDYERGNAWRYRDYVVRSFQQDKPYDRFIKEQLAGDELEPQNSEMLVATGFLRMGPWELTGMEVAKVARQRFLDDVTNSVGETFLAHSLQCARCHDHKFDPIPTGDYYGLQAVFGTTQLAERNAPFLTEENTQGFAEKKYLQQRQDEHHAVLDRLNEVLLANGEQWYVDRKRDATAWKAAVAKHGSFEAARKAMASSGAPEDSYPPKNAGFSPTQYGEERVARKGIERLRWEFDRYEPYALAVYSGATPQVNSVLAPQRMPKDPMKAGELEETCVLAGGDPFSSGQKVRPSVLSVLGLPASIPEAPTGRRAAFAEWVANAANPLTTRSIVNRLWMWHFTQPLAGNPNNFGSTGKKPTHPELLDWLAATFVEKGWSVKALHRLLMTSQAYRRSSQAPLNAQISREEQEKQYTVFTPRRLSAEELRDATLAVSGELNREIGGVPNRPEINLEAAMQPRQVMGTFAAAWVPNPLPRQRHRRSLYALKLRGLTDPLLEVFNAPTPDFSCERRDASTVTPQVFALFNSQNSAARALAMAARALRETSQEAEAIEKCLVWCYGRKTTATELTLCLEHWKSQITIQNKATFTPQQPPLNVRREAVEENTGENFTFEEKLHAYADFVPDLQPHQCDARTRALADVCLSLLNSNEFAYVY